jgi:hypothetical protein
MGCKENYLLKRGREMKKGEKEKGERWHAAGKRNVRYAQWVSRKGAKTQMKFAAFEGEGTES